MARVLFASELGGNFGHVGQLLPLALELKSRGNEVIFALRDVGAADAILRAHGSSKDAQRATSGWDS